MSPRIEDPTTRALAATIQDGGDAAIEAERLLCARMLPRIRIFLARHHRDPYAVEDLSQDALLALLEGLRAGRVKNLDAVGSFAMGICRNKLREDARRNVRRHRAMVRSEVSSFAEMTTPRLRMGRLEECLHFLRERDRVLLRMVFVEGLSSRGAGEALGTSSAAIRVRQHRAIDQLRKCLGVGRYEAER